MCHRFVTILFSFVGTILAGAAAFGCSFLAGDVPGRSMTFGIGFLGVSRWGSKLLKDYTCRPHFLHHFVDIIDDVPGFQKYDFDSYWYAAYAFAVISFVLGFFAFVFSVCSIFKYGSSKGDSCLGGFLLFITLCQGLSLLVFSSNVIDLYSVAVSENHAGFKLGVGPGAGCAIAAVVVWFFAAISACTTGRKGDDRDASREIDAEEPLLANDEAEAA
mmetsp:Transcript_884/g.1249  ORF Transcript_884/g.1249 Transcript_884/m.1249 type:complete len:217 (+) Transcript_884:65-715(+)